MQNADWQIPCQPPETSSSASGLPVHTGEGGTEGGCTACSHGLRKPSRRFVGPERFIDHALTSIPRPTPKARSALKMRHYRPVTGIHSPTRPRYPDGMSAADPVTRAAPDSRAAWRGRCTASTTISTPGMACDSDINILKWPSTELPFP